MTELLVERAAQQKDNLCGPFWGARVLRDFGIAAWNGEPIDEDLIALHAKTVLPEEADDFVPPGAQRRVNYRYDLPTGPAAGAGTSADALAAAIEAAAAGTLRCVPVRGDWTGERVGRIVDAARRIGARLLANIRTGRLWGTRPPLESLIRELEGRENAGPPAEWDVGHFVELAALLTGAGGSLVLVRDSYPQFGLNGHHLQPPRVLAAALNRGDGREGGVLAVAGRERTSDLEALVGEVGLAIGFWDNGTRR